MSVRPRGSYLKNFNRISFVFAFAFGIVNLHEDLWSDFNFLRMSYN